MTDLEKFQFFTHFLPTVKYLMLLSFVFGVIVGAFFFGRSIQLIQSYLIRRQRIKNTQGF